MAESFCIPTSDESCYCFLPSWTFSVVSALDIGYSNGYVVISHCCFNLHFHEHITFAIYISSLMRCLFRSLAHYSARFLVFLLLSFKSSLYILYIIFYQLWFLQTLSPNLWLVFSFSWLCFFFSEQSFNFNESSLSTLSCYLCL